MILILSTTEFLYRLHGTYIIITWGKPLTTSFCGVNDLSWFTFYDMCPLLSACCHFAIVVFSESSDSATHVADNDEEPSIGE